MRNDQAGRWAWQYILDYNMIYFFEKLQNPYSFIPLFRRGNLPSNSQEAFFL